MLHAVIMAGGSGTRFWPLSRHAFPKQFLTLSGERSLIQSTSDRCLGLIPSERHWVVTNAAQAEETRRQLPALPTDQVLVEPCARNTAPCVALAAAALVRKDPDAVMVVLPADHVIQPIEQFTQAVERGSRLITENGKRLVLFGVVPSFPSTGFGYIERGKPLNDQAYHVQSFREKPNRETAETYLRSGQFYWNCGIFIWKASTILEAIAEFEPEMKQLTDRIGAAMSGPKYDPTLKELFPQMKSISIDFAVLERSHNIVVLEAPFGWDDVGSWEAVTRLSGSDSSGNTIQGAHCGVATERCIIHSTDDHLVATLGLKDCIVVHTPDATLVASRGDENAIKQLIESLKQQGLGKYL